MGAVHAVVVGCPEPLVQRLLADASDRASIRSKKDPRGNGDPADVVLIGPCLEHPVQAVQMLFQHHREASFLIAARAADLERVSQNLMVSPFVSSTTHLTVYEDDSSMAAEFFEAIEAVRAQGRDRKSLDAVLDALEESQETPRPDFDPIEHLHIRERFLSELVESSTDAIVSKDLDGCITSWNLGATRLYGYPASQTLGQPIGLIVPDDRLDELFQIDARVLKGEPVRALETVRLARDGRRIDVSITVSPILDARGDVIGASAIARDVSDQKRAQELERRLLHADRLASIGQLAAGVAHEVNNPSTFIQANQEMLNRELDDLEAMHRDLRERLSQSIGESGAAVFDAVTAEHELDLHMSDMREMVQDCVAGIQRITSVVRDLSAFSRIEHDDIQAVNLNEVVKVACRMARNEIRPRAELKTRLGELPLIAGDRAKLVQVVVNLLVNATHAIGDGSREDNCITVETFRRNSSLVLAVEDTGCGVPEEDQARIFEPFFTTKERGVGTGLGLSISAETVRKHGGEIHIHSEVGKGTRFEVTLPEVTNLTVRVDNDIDDDDGSETASGRILVIDDERYIRSAMRRTLTRAGHEVVEASNGESALQILAEGSRFDLIMCDLIMPELDGPAFYEHLRDRIPELLDRLVFITGGAFTDRTKAFIAAANPVILNKPVPTNKLHEVARRFVSRRNGS